MGILASRHRRHRELMLIAFEQRSLSSVPSAALPLARRSQENPAIA